VVTVPKECPESSRNTAAGLPSVEDAVPLINQYNGWLFLPNYHSAGSVGVTFVPPANRALLVEIALASVRVQDETSHSAVCLITNVTSVTGTEAFSYPNPTITRFAVTRVTFALRATNCDASARWVVHEWS
jgi:hypothetical protein